MKLKSFGCSFIFGSELHDDGYNSARATPSQFTWPALWAQHLGLDYECYAKPGSGNTRIAESVLSQIHSKEPAIYVIGWTWIERFDFVQRSGDQWRTLTAWDTDSVAVNYYRDLHSQYTDKLQSLSMISLTVNHLQASGSKFYMTYMDDLLWETQYHHSKSMALMQQQLRPVLHNFQGQNFLDWSFARGYPIGIRGKHPLEAAHRAAFEYVNSVHSF